MKAKILYIERKYWTKNLLAFSLEKLFEQIARRLSIEKFETEFVKVPFGNSIFDTLRNYIFFKPKAADIYHVTGQIHYLALALPRERTVLTIHDLDFLRVKRGFRRFLIKKIYLDWPVKKLRYITAVSETTRRLIVENTNCPPEKIRLIENPVMEHFQASEKGAFNKDCPLILQIGISKNKNIPNLIEALKGIKCRLRIIGNLPVDLENILKANRIDFENAYGLDESEIRIEYQKADLVSFCSVSEGFGLPIIEAQMMKTPLLTSDLSPLKEVAGGGAFLADPFDPQSIREGVLKMIEDDDFRRKIVKKGAENVRRYDLQQIVGLYENLYSEILSGIE